MFFICLANAILYQRDSGQAGMTIENRPFAIELPTYFKKEPSLLYMRQNENYDAKTTKTTPMTISVAPSMRSRKCVSPKTM